MTLVTEKGTFIPKADEGGSFRPKLVLLWGEADLKEFTQDGFTLNWNWTEVPKEAD